MVKIALPSHWKTDRGWYTRAGTLQDRTCWRRFITHHHHSESPTTRFVQTRNICQDRETGVDRCFVGAFQFSKWTSALHSFFQGGEFNVVNTTQQFGVYFMMLCGCFSVYSEIWFLRCLCPCVCGCGGRLISLRSSNWPFDQFSSNISHLAVQKGDLASKACKLITWGQFDYIAICKEWGGGVRRWGKIVL